MPAKVERLSDYAARKVVLLVELRGIQTERCMRAWSPGKKKIVFLPKFRRDGRPLIENLTEGAQYWAVVRLPHFMARDRALYGAQAPRAPNDWLASQLLDTRSPVEITRDREINTAEFLVRVEGANCAQPRRSSELKKRQWDMPYGFTA